MQYLANSSVPTKLASARGFQVATVSGLVSEVRWDQEGVRTDAIILNWWQPSGSFDVGALRTLERQEAFPHQEHTQATKSALGQSGHTVPTAAVKPDQPLPRGVPYGGVQYQVLQMPDSSGVSDPIWGWVCAHA
jgi:hypothetical protein